MAVEIVTNVLRGLVVGHWTDGSESLIQERNKSEDGRREWISIAMAKVIEETYLK